MSFILHFFMSFIHSEENVSSSTLRCTRVPKHATLQYRPAAAASHDCSAVTTQITWHAPA